MELYLLMAAIVLLIIILVLLAAMAVRGRTENKALTDEMRTLTDKNYEQQIKLMETLNLSADKQSRAVAESIGLLQASNEKKLEEMRRTVDEQLGDTLDKRLGNSFQTVSQQLGRVYQSLGEMKELSAGVTDSVNGLNRVLSNVKSRGTWAEVMLGNILDETVPGMYEKNVRTNPKYNGQVEFAVRIPHPEDGGVTYLPIDAKFPMEDYVRLSRAAENGDGNAAYEAKRALEQRVKYEARAIRQYISVPETTPFAIMYLATEGLYAEIISAQSGIYEWLQAQGIMLAGPSTVLALLNALSIGFRSIAINQKASEVYKVLGAAKAQYDKFGEQLELARRRITAAGEALEEADKRNEIIKKRLKDIETFDLEESS